MDREPNLDQTKPVSDFIPPQRIEITHKEITEKRSLGSLVASYLIALDYPDEDPLYDPSAVTDKYNALVAERFNKEADPKAIPPVIILPGVGRNSRSEMIVRTVDTLTKAGITGLAIDSPPFSGEFASFEAQADWLKQHLVERGITGKIIFYGHSRGDLIGRHFLDKYPDLVQAYIGTCGPARSETDNYPTEIEAGLKLGKEIGVFPALSRFLDRYNIPIRDDFARWFVNNFDEAADIYLGHIDAGKKWDDLACRATRTVKTYFFFGGKDNIVNRVGSSSCENYSGATICIHPDLDHKMIPIDQVVSVVKTVFAESIPAPTL